MPKASDEVYTLVESIGRRWVHQVDDGERLGTKYLERELISVKHKASTLSVEPAIQVRNMVARVKRLNKHDKAFKLDVGERRRLKPQVKQRKTVKPIKFRGDGIDFY